MDDEYYMTEALKEAKKAYDLKEVPIGAVLVKDGKIVGRGYNRVEIDKNPLAHAEIMAIDDARGSFEGWRLLGSVLYVTLEPCAMCAGACVHSRIERVVIGAMDKKRGASGSKINLLNFPDFNHTCQVTSGVLEEECSKILSDFFKNLREERKGQMK